MRFNIRLYLRDSAIPAVMHSAAHEVPDRVNALIRGFITEGR